MQHEQKFAHKVFPYLSDVTSYGREVMVPPWADRSQWVAMLDLPDYARTRLAVRKLLMTLALVAVVSGILFGWRVNVAFGVALLVALHWACSRAFNTLEHLKIAKVVVPHEVHEREDVPVQLHCVNTGRKSIDFATVLLRFSGDHRRDFFHPIGGLGPGERRVVRVNMKADAGMGEHELMPIMVATGDGTGVGNFAVYANDEHYTVRVLPEDIAIEPLVLRRAGLSMHAGLVEVRAPGASPNFLGLRPWREGDGIRYVDWKRSVRTGDLVVREFEKMNATDCTIFFDENKLGHSAFANVSSIEAMRDSMLSIARRLLDQQLRVQLISADNQLPMAGGRNQFEMLPDFMLSLEFQSQQPIHEVIDHYAPMVPPDSLVVILACTNSFHGERMVKNLMMLEDLRADPFLVLFDSQSFAEQVQEQASLTEDFGQRMMNFMPELTTLSHKSPLRDSQRLVERTFIVQAGETIGDVYRGEPHLGGG